ncbi:MULTISPECIES: hypothetical protein [unclassified Salinivibrio]|uniref:hypothetical protein n=1 Tax=unclassified Salinivibrio TaxID=2636825 RepID=UPI0012C11839|nr:hypothetical protein [Salinivibrio sp. VYel7]MPX92649.1 hypothetical protein [Salinivibrio sp. VYel9]MPX96852.1 hypothetical protein [Salinivibrio sp. VYel6]MPY01324.1 hypothetical protein [Salinivibrio sp. VYel4]MPY01417.1 hypothetical protein [Salinivibrio sp. VYel5]MPY04333.1 hypothetical protein [Salinivibrio sp. VYel8]MPY12926.1 hypothetical protein [Salinivibrio sp. VGrn1]
MEELSLLNELGFESHVSIGAAFVLLSFIIKRLYTEHMQRFMREAWGFISRRLIQYKSNIPPSLYEMMPVRAQCWFDTFEMTCGYTVVLVCLAYELFIIYWTTKPEFWLLPLDMQIKLAGMFCLLVLFKFTALKISNRILHQKLKSR